LSQIDTGSGSENGRIQKTVCANRHLTSNVDKKIWSRDILICEKVLGILTPTPPGVELERTNARFYYAGHRKTRQQQKGRICRVITSWCKNEVPETRFLAGLFDKIELNQFEGLNNNYY